jgi:hypothetical protein
VFDKALDGLKEANVDICDPVQMLYVLKMLGPADFEEMFGADKADEDSLRGRQPVVPTDVYALLQSIINAYGHIFDNPNSRSILKGRKLLIASTDVHAHAITIIHELLSRAGTKIINLGAEINPPEDRARQAKVRCSGCNGRNPKSKNGRCGLTRRCQREPQRTGVLSQSQIGGQIPKIA